MDTKIKLIKPSLEHLPFFIRWENDEELGRLTGVDVPRSDSEIEGSIKAYLNGEKPKLLYYCIEYNGLIVGKIELYFASEFEVCTGCFIDKEFRKIGIASQAYDLLFKLHQLLLDKKEIVAEIYSDNKGSIRFFENLGFGYSGKTTDETIKGETRLLMEFRASLFCP